MNVDRVPRPRPLAASIALGLIACRGPSSVPLPDTGGTRAPDGRIAFIRPTPNHLVSTSLGDEQATELWIASADGSHARRLVEGTAAVIPRGPLAGCLLVGQHRYRPSEGGSYDWTWLLTGDGKEIALAATDSAGADRRTAVWMSGVIPDGAFGSGGAAPSNVRCS